MASYIRAVHRMAPNANACQMGTAQVTLAIPVSAPAHVSSRKVGAIAPPHVLAVDIHCATSRESTVLLLPSLLLILLRILLLLMGCCQGRFPAEGLCRASNETCTAAHSIRRVRALYPAPTHPATEVLWPACALECPESVHVLASCERQGVAIQRLSKACEVIDSVADITSADFFDWL